MLASVARRILPIKARQVLGCWTLNQSSKSKFLLHPYLYLMHGQVPTNLRLLPHGKTIYNFNGIDIMSPRDGIGSLLEIFQEEVYDKILKIQENDTVIDVGAYVGMFTVKAALRAEKVIAIEPDRLNFEYLGQNCKNLKNVVLVSRVISNDVSRKEFYISPATACHSLIYKQKTKTEVWTDTLDNIARKLELPKVDFIKIDAEGAEMKVLQGAEKTLKGSVKLSIASYHTSPDGKPEAPKVIEFLEARGFYIQTDSGLRRYIYAQKVA